MEIYQPEAIFYHTLKFSRIDRAYTNTSIDEIYTIRIEARSLNHIALSDHKPIALSIFAGHQCSNGPPKLGDWTFEHKESPRLTRHF